MDDKQNRLTGLNVFIPSFQSKTDTKVRYKRQTDWIELPKSKLVSQFVETFLYKQKKWPQTFLSFYRM